MKYSAEAAADVAAKIRALSPPDQLRFAADLLERRNPVLAHAILQLVADELGAALALRSSGDGGAK